jgi:hypothetical protein
MAACAAPGSSRTSVFGMPRYELAYGLHNVVAGIEALNRCTPRVNAPSTTNFAPLARTAGQTLAGYTAFALFPLGANQFRHTELHSAFRITLIVKQSACQERQGRAAAPRECKQGNASIWVIERRTHWRGRAATQSSAGFGHGAQKLHAVSPGARSGAQKLHAVSPGAGSGTDPVRSA